MGFSIIATFAGTGYYGAGAGAISSDTNRHLRHTTERISPLSRLDRVSEKNHPTKGAGRAGKVKGKVPGPIQVEENQEGEAYLTLRNIEQEEEDEEKEEEEAKKKEEEEEEEKKKAEEEDGKDEKDGEDEGKSDDKPKSEDAGKSQQMLDKGGEKGEAGKGALG